MYKARDIRRIATVIKFNDEYFLNLEYIGRFKVGKIVAWAKTEVPGFKRPIPIPIISETMVNEKMRSLSDDPLTIGTMIDSIEEGKRFELIRQKRYREAGYVKANVMLLNPIHVKRTFIKYNWLKENGFIGPDDILVLKNEDQYGLYRNIREFLDKNQDFIKAFKNEGRVISYKFCKYGIEGVVEKRRDGTGKMTMYTPKEQVDIQYIIRDEDSFIDGISINKKTNKYYGEKVNEKEIRRLTEEINNIIYSVGGDKYID